MSTVTRIAIIEEPQAKANVYLDGKRAFTLPIDIASSLHVNQNLTDEEIKTLETYSEYFTCLASAKRLVTNRPHSRMELKNKLKQKKYPAECIDKALDSLEQTGLVDDSAFAAYWIETRSYCRPEGKMMAASELRAKGVSSDIINESLKSLNEEECAFQAADRLAEKLAGSDYETFKKKVSGLLSRRGFNYDITRQTTEKLWHKYKNTNNEEYEYVSED